MKIHGTTKGGAISKKNFGVAFGGGNGGVPMVCYNADELNTYYEFTKLTGTNFVLGAYIDGTSNPVYDKDVTAISIYIYAEADTSGGVFALGVWDSSGNLKNESDTFSVDDMPVGTAPANPTEKITKTITSTTIEDGDTIGIINKTAFTGDGEVANGGYDKGSAIANWKRGVFTQGGSVTANPDRVLVICVNE